MGKNSGKDFVKEIVSISLMIAEKLEFSKTGSITIRSEEIKEVAPGRFSPRDLTYYVSGKMTPALYRMVKDMKSGDILHILEISPFEDEEGKFCITKADCEFSQPAKKVKAAPPKKGRGAVYTEGEEETPF